MSYDTAIFYKHFSPWLCDNIADLAAKGSLLHDNDDTRLVVRDLIIVSPSVCKSRSPFDGPVCIYMPQLARTIYLCLPDRESYMHVTLMPLVISVSYTLTLNILERFYGWVGMEACMEWRVRCCLKCQVYKTSHQTVCSVVLHIPLPSGLDVSVSVDYF